MRAPLSPRESLLRKCLEAVHDSVCPEVEREAQVMLLASHSLFESHPVAAIKLRDAGNAYYLRDDSRLRKSLMDIARMEVIPDFFGFLCDLKQVLDAESGVNAADPDASL